MDTFGNLASRQTRSIDCESATVIALELDNNHKFVKYNVMGSPARTEVIFYAEGGKSPSLEWLLEQPNKVQDKFDFLISLLEDKGSRLQRPYAAPLGRKIYELRARWQNVNYRLLYFFDSGTAAIIAHGCTKEDTVERADIDRAAARREKYLNHPASHTYSEAG